VQTQYKCFHSLRRGTPSVKCIAMN
jgi:hypothetical protein